MPENVLYQLPKLKVAGSRPVSRSIALRQRFLDPFLNNSGKHLENDAAAFLGLLALTISPGGEHRYNM